MSQYPSPEFEQWWKDNTWSEPQTERFDTVKFWHSIAAKYATFVNQRVTIERDAYKAANAHLRDEIYRVHASYKSDGVWRWQGDEEDHPESLTCGILITAEEMRKLLAKHTAAVKEAEKATLEVIEERDDLETRLTQLAEAVGYYMGTHVGEWSSSNSPDIEALKALNGEYITQPQRERELLASALAGLERRVVELVIESDFNRQMERSNSPCGHNARYAYTDNGGKTGVCLLCEHNERHTSTPKRPLFTPYDYMPNGEPPHPTQPCPYCGGAGAKATAEVSSYFPLKVEVSLKVCARCSAPKEVPWP